MVGAVRSLLGVAANPWFEADIVRTVARDRLERREPATGCPWSIDRTVANAGIHLSVPVGSIRVVRGDLTRVPPPGYSHARRDFWSQGRFALFSDESTPTAAPALRILMLWTPAAAGSVRLTLAVPAGSWRFGAPSRLLAAATLEPTTPEGEFDAGDDDGADLVALIQPESDEEMG